MAVVINKAMIINMAVGVICQAIPPILLPTTRGKYVFSSSNCFVTTAGRF